MQEMKVKGLSHEALEASSRLESQAKTAVLVAIDLEVRLSGAERKAFALFALQ